MPFPVLPEGIKDNIAGPLPWPPSERSSILDDFLNKNTNKETDINALRKYLRLVNKRYIITDFGIPAVEASVGHIDDHTNAMHPPARTAASQTSVLQHFDRRMLGFAPDNTDDGLVWSGSSGDFTGGIYDASSVAEIMGTNAVRLNEILSDEKMTHRGYVIIRAANFLAIVAGLNKDNVLIGDVAELTRDGQTLVDAGLSDVERSVRDQAGIWL
jgi:hypothetical protein